MFSRELHSKYQVVALGMKATKDLLQMLGKVPPAKQQSVLDMFVFAERLTGDDVSDVMYDVEKAKFFNLKKPDGKEPPNFKKLAEAMREHVVEDYKSTMGGRFGKLDWDEQQQVFHLEESADAKEIVRIFFTEEAPEEPSDFF